MDELTDSLKTGRTYGTDDHIKDVKSEKELQVPRSLASLQQGIDELEGSIDSLGTRLITVCREIIQVPKDSSVKNKASTGVPLVDDIDSKVSYMHELKGKIDDLISRLEV